MELTVGKSSIVEMHELVVHKEDEAEVVIGRTETGTFIAMPAIGHEIIEFLQRGLTIGETEHLLYEKYAEPFDVSAFVEELMIDYRFVYRLNGHIVNSRVPIKEHFSWLPAETGRIFFHPIAYSIYFAILLSAAGIAFLHPAYLPSYKDYLPAPSALVNLIISFAAAWSFLFLHEFAHLIAARSLGVHCRIGLGHRLIFPVAETDMSGIVVVPRNHRYGAYIAGMCWDLVFLSAGMWLQWLHDLRMIAMSENVLHTIRLINGNLTALILFQFLFFMKTDLYYVFTNYVRCPNLLEHTFLYVKRCFISNPQVTEHWDEVSSREKKIVYGFAWFYAVGVIAVGVWGLVRLPNLYRFLTATIAQLSRMPLLSWDFAASMLLIGLCLLPTAVLIWSWSQSIRMKGGEHVDQS
ncbi:hypothetical protein GE107_09020 [Cohnella sp. CFH 77786]|uniref:hypothetical protein n=1 Tax=Cohnella sp. CFH 77786 TaxID=2662265 RepID=UPI001C6108C5|nr:hypothetical protein [Cohnella sp. CFH 77786]MBW5446199.1 hypothetical protein [Cohnella sp. CFH 77786]